MTSPCSELSLKLSCLLGSCTKLVRICDVVCKSVSVCFSTWCRSSDATGGAGRYHHCEGHEIPYSGEQHTQLTETVRVAMMMLAPLPCIDQVALCLLSIVVMAGAWSITKSWQWTQTIADGAERKQEGPSSSLRAQKLEAEEDFAGAMQALLGSHHAGDSQAVMLAHELCRRHPDAFEAKGCPVLSQRGERETGQSVVAARATVAAPSQMQEMAGTAARNVAVRVSMEAGETTAVGQLQQKQTEGETPWERGWQGSEGFQPPSSSRPATGSAHSSSAKSPGDVSIHYVVELRNFTIAQLNVFNGGLPALLKRGGVIRKPRPIYIALRGNVYDASTGRDLYGLVSESKLTFGFTDCNIYLHNGSIVTAS